MGPDLRHQQVINSHVVLDGNTDDIDKFTQTFSADSGTAQNQAAFTGYNQFNRLMRLPNNSFEMKLVVYG